jgi:peptide/nickel transport system permease protein
MVMPKFVMLWTDVAIWLLVVAMVVYGAAVSRKPNLAANWGKVFRNGPALASSLVLLACLLVTLFDACTSARRSIGGEGRRRAGL